MHTTNKHFACVALPRHFTQLCMQLHTFARKCITILFNHTRVYPEVSGLSR